MTRRSFDEGWSFRPKVTAFQELGGSSGAEWTPVTLPHDAMISTPRRADAPRGETNGYFDGGAFEYRTFLDVTDDERGKVVILEFDGVYRDAMIYVNGSLAGQRAFGYSRFLVRIDPFLIVGSNEIRVDCRTHLDSRWYAGAGIHRGVTLISKGLTHLTPDGVTITTADVDDSRAVVEVASHVTNSGPLTATLTLAAAVDRQGTIVASTIAPVTVLPGESAVVRQRLYVKTPDLWSVESPSLYNLALSLCDGDTAVDEESAVFGIRTMQLDPASGLRINGQTVKLRGACIHSDNGPLGAVSVRAAEERRVQRLKDAGFNAIRNSHNPASTALLDACDRVGMLVIDETFDMWTSAKSSFDYAFDFPEWWERDIEALVAKDRNHPSVIMYCIGNEIPETGNRFGAIWGRRLAEKLRSLDPTRYITNGINGFVSTMDVILPAMQARRDAAATGGGVNEMMTGFGEMMGQIQASPMVGERTAESFAVLDVAGMNYGDARYESDTELFPDRIIVGTETWPNQIDRNWALVQGNDHVIGDFTWTGWDYLGETGIGLVQYAEDNGDMAGFSTGYPGLTAWCGDIDITGERRPVSFWRETVFGLRDTPYIAVHRPTRYSSTIAVSTPWSWSDAIGSWSWAGFEGAPIRVEVYSDAEEIELQLEGTSIGRVRVGATKTFRADFDTIYRQGELVAIAYTAGVETGRAALTSATDALAVEVTPERSEVRADSTDLAFVAIALTDGQGTVHPGLDRAVTVSVSGPGVLQALGSANPVTEETFSTATHQTFDGRALAIIRPTGPGHITVEVSTEGAESVAVKITAG